MTEKPLIEPTADEAKNGWTAKTLTAYLAQQQASQAMRNDWTSALRRKPRPSLANSDYRPSRWRGFINR
jgi:hypothetical protein